MGETDHLGFSFVNQPVHARSRLSSWLLLNALVALWPLAQGSLAMTRMAADGRRGTT